MKTSKRKNPVAKYSGFFNKSKVYRDRTKYTRNKKHKLILDD